MLLHRDHLSVNRGPKAHYPRPAIDPLFTSATAAYGQRVVGVLLSGAGDDGVTDLIHVKAGEGLVLVQDPREAKMPSMPSSAMLRDHVDYAAPLADLASVLTRLAHGHVIEK